MKMNLGHMELSILVLSGVTRPLEDHAIAEVMDALSWHPYVAVDLRDGASVLALVGRADPELGARIRRLAGDALVLAGGDEVSATRAALVGRTLEGLLAGTPADQLEELATGWEVAELARSWLDRGIGDPERLREIIAGIDEARPAWAGPAKARPPTVDDAR